MLQFTTPKYIHSRQLQTTFHKLLYSNKRVCKFFVRNVQLSTDILQFQKDTIIKFNVLTTDIITTQHTNNSSKKSQTETQEIKSRLLYISNTQQVTPQHY